MEEDSDKERTLEDWVRTIKNLSESRYIIAKATKLATVNSHLAPDLFAYLLRTLKRSSGDLKRRKAIFYLLDSICQVSKGQDEANEYLNLVEKNIRPIVSMVIQPDTLGADNKAVVEKVLHIWGKRGIFSSEVIEQALAELETAASFQARGKRKAISPEVEECLKEMERYRHEHKKMRRELSLRPKNEPEGAEFEEMWEKATADKKLVSLFFGDKASFERKESAGHGYSGHSNSPPERSDSKRGRTPSPATPSTPYSPSVPFSKFSLSPQSHTTTRGSHYSNSHPPQNLYPPQVSRASSTLPSPHLPVPSASSFPSYGQESVSCPPPVPRPKIAFYNPNNPTTP